MAPSWTELIRDVPDFPEPGVVYKDITPLLGDGAAFRTVVDALVDQLAPHEPSKVVGIEARGFILGAAVAYQLGAGFVPLRKAGKLPYETHEVVYDLEYGTDQLEGHIDALEPGERVAVIDDVLATGGTAAAACKLVERLGGEIVGVATLLELAFLHGRERLNGYEVTALVRVES